MSNKTKYILISLGILLSVLFSYRNIYDNSFHFDDSHTIQDNPFITDISNIPLFFTKGAITFSSLPANQVYRPIVTTSIAIDYWISSKLSSDGNGFHMRYYHYSMMITYILLLVLLFFFFLKLFEKARPNSWNIYFAFFATAFYGLHTVNAETINYIISRSDLLSTFFVIAAFDIFLYFPNKRKWGLFLIPLALGVLTKLTAAMFIPMLIVYYFIYEFLPLNKTERKKQIKGLVLYASALVLLMLVVVVFVMKMQSDTFVPGTHTRWQYLITMPYVLLHYFISFIYPYNLSADTDWTVIDSILNYQFIVGILFLVSILFIAFISLKNKKYAPISFGIFWFFIALAPTSSFIPLAEVMNDHRMFYPFVGLTLMWVYIVSIWIVNIKEQIIKSKSLKLKIIIASLIILGLHSYGTFQRTEIWNDGESLWYDVTIKSPKNGRGLMNYGLKLMNKGDYDSAMKYYKKALKYSPKYSYLHTNMGICYDSMGKYAKADSSFKKAIEYAYYSYKPHYFYGANLLKHKKYQEAIKEFELSLKYNPQYNYSMYKLMECYTIEEDWENLDRIIGICKSYYPNNTYAKYYVPIAKERITKLDIAREASIKNPSVDSYIELSLKYYFYNKYDSSIWAANQALEINSKSVAAYNNICAANNVLGNYSSAIIAGKMATKLDPNNQLAWNNLNLSYKRQKLQNRINETNDFNKLIDLSLTLYKEEMYNDCIKACEKAIEIQPNNAIPYNNICSAYNALKQYEKAVKAGEMAVKLDSNSELAKNNLALAKSKLQDYSSNNQFIPINRK